MACFPMSVDLTGKTVILVGSGPQIRDKAEKLRPFGPELVFLDELCREDLTEEVAFVVAGGLDREEARKVSALCRASRVAVNVVDDSENSTFFFPAILSWGDLTVSVSTGGKVPAAAGCMAAHIGQCLPADTEQILQWLEVLRKTLYADYPKAEARRILGLAARQAIAQGRCLTESEWKKL